MTQQIRQITENDVDEVSTLFNDYRIFYNKESDLSKAKEFILERYKKDESKIFVTEVNNKICGFIQLYPLFSSTRMKRLWLLNDLFVDSSYRKQGIAKSLLMKAKQFAVKTKSAGFILETARDNTTANLLYKSVGLEFDNSHYYYSYNTI